MTRRAGVASSVENWQSLCVHVCMRACVCARVRVFVRVHVRAHADMLHHLSSPAGVQQQYSSTQAAASPGYLLCCTFGSLLPVAQHRHQTVQLLIEYLQL
uniref:Uncharacterized protein n=1 Tax=Dunaliella tertiolecta TaxID=3047 RepID=A0A7S3QVU6_DUNTE|mmetsp:Transcript_17517/g.45898  ORF Transcript_17517/g.45898 Transcript_17517/m.45898 type:complete len:100 (-) Transcript_17517:194-493(-)